MNMDEYTKTELIDLILNVQNILKLVKLIQNWQLSLNFKSMDPSQAHVLEIEVRQN